MRTALKRKRLAVRWTSWVLAMVAVPLSAGLAVVAVDALRAPAELTLDDARFLTMPRRQEGLWNVGFVPRNGTESVLGLDDDVQYRRLAALYVMVEPGKIEWPGFPELEAVRAKVQLGLTLQSRSDPDPRRRSRLLTLYGVMTLDDRITRPEERRTLLLEAISAFTNAIELDPGNEDAKTNLEMALRAFGFLAIPGDLPGGIREGGPISGQGVKGTGY